jgi:alkaline phosphatase D
MDTALRIPTTLRGFVAAAMVLLAACGDANPGAPEVPSAGDPGGRPPGLEVPDPESATGGENAASRLGAPYVVVVSLDGFASRYMEQHQPAALEALAAGGVWAPEGMIPVYPSKTFPNHYALATGMYPVRNGIVANTFLDPARGAWYSLGDRSTVQDGSWYRGEPLWVTAERQGMVAASFYWVGSEAAVGGVRPSYWRQYDAGVPNDDRVDQVLEWLTYPAEYRPHLVMLYFSTTDAVGHQFGPDSPEMAQAVASVDGSLSRLIAGVAALPHAGRVTLIVLSDHGMDHYAVSGRRYIADAVGLDGLIIPESGPAANVHVDEGIQTAAAVRDAVNTGLDGVTAYLAEEVPERFHYRGDPRIGDVVLVPDSGIVVYPANDRPESAGWTHGWDNALLSMRALFVASGPGLPTAREIDPFEAVHIYPLVTRILGLAPAVGIDGTAAAWDGILGGG